MEFLLKNAQFVKNKYIASGKYQTEDKEEIEILLKRDGVKKVADIVKETKEEFKGKKK